MTSGRLGLAKHRHGSVRWYTRLRLQANTALHTTRSYVAVFRGGLIGHPAWQHLIHRQVARVSLVVGQPSDHLVRRRARRSTADPLRVLYYGCVTGTATPAGPARTGP